MAASDLTTLSAVRLFLRITDATQTDGDSQLSVWITQASAAIARYTGRQFVAENSAEHRFAYFGGGRLPLSPYDLRSVTSVEIDTETASPITLVEGSDFLVLPRDSRSGVYTSLELRGYEPAAATSSNASRPWREVSITGDWGFSAVPDEVVAACNMLVAWWHRNQSTVPGGSLDGEGDRYGASGFPSSVLQLLAPYRVIGFGYGG